VNYVEVEEAIGLPGLRLVLSAGVPGPWGESAKYCLSVKRIPYTAVRQTAGSESAALKRWTGQSNAPIALLDDEAPRSGWSEILALAERIAPEPTLTPADPEQRVRMFGLAHEICGEGGFGWQRRLMLIASLGTSNDITRTLARRYGYTDSASAAAPGRSAEILLLLSKQLRAQRALGSPYFVGERLSAVDLYWAAFALMVEPLGDDHCRLHPRLRESYALRDPAVRAAADEILLEHRDFIYRTHLALPLDF
jgi:glutathione S-transferase